MMPDTKQPEQKFYSSPKLPLNSIPGIPENINIPPQPKRLDYSEFRDDANDI
jgi:hypothetical protein